MMAVANASLFDTLWRWELSLKLKFWDFAYTRVFNFELCITLGFIDIVLKADIFFYYFIVFIVYECMYFKKQPNEMLCMNPCDMARPTTLTI